MWENPHAFGNQVDRSNPQTSSSGNVKRTGEHFSWYSSDDLRATIEPPSFWQYKPGNFLAIRPLNWDEIIDNNDDGENQADRGAPSSRRSSPGDCNDNDNGKGEEDIPSVEKGTGKEKGTKDGKGKGTATEDRKGNGKAKGKGKGNHKGKGILKQTPGEMISLVPLLCSCRRKCMRQTWTQRAN